jgi:hypothetical protein
MAEQPELPAQHAEEVPRLPRGRGIKLSGPELFRVLLIICMLVAVLVLAKPCGDAVSKFVMGFDGSGSASGSARPKPTPAPAPTTGMGSGGSDQYEHLTPGMTDDEVKAAIERAKHKAGSAQ